MPSPAPLGSIGTLDATFDRLRLRPAYFIDRDRLRTRYVQTSAVYVILRALYSHVIGYPSVSASLIRDVFYELAAMAGLNDPEPQFDTSVDSATFFSMLSSLIVSTQAPRHDSIAMENVSYLLIAGQHKVAAHLRVIRASWAAHISAIPVCSRTRAQSVISDVITCC